MIDKTERLLLRTSSAADLLGVHPSTIKRWADDGSLPSTKTDGGHRRVHLKDALAVARARGIKTYLDPFSPWESNVWLAVTAAEQPDGFGRLIGLALGWLARGDAELLGRLFFEVGRRETIPFPRFLDEGVRGFMASVGEEWRRGRLQVGEEHLATQVVLEALLRIRISRESEELPGMDRLDPRSVAVVGSAEGDLHELGAQSIRAILEREGWKVYYLGPNVPVEDFAAVQRAQVADLVCISFSSSRTLPDLQRAVKVLGKSYRHRTPYSLALGGAVEVPGLDALGRGPFEELSYSKSAGDFSSWLRSRSTGEPYRESGRVA